MARYDDPLDAANSLPAGFSRYIDPAQAAQAGLQWTGGNTGWQPFVSPEQAKAQGLQYTGGTAPDPAAQKYGYIIPEGGGPVTLGTPENLQGGASMATGPAADALSAAFNSRSRSEQFLSAVAPIQQRQQELATRLESANRRQAPGILSQIKGLDQNRQALQFAYEQDRKQLDFEANQRRMMAHENASESHRQLSTDRETEIDEQGHALLQGMGKLDSMLRNGRIDKDTYDDSLLALGAQLPLATRHPEAARHFEFAITEADKQNAYNARRELTQAAKLGAKYGIEPQIDPETGRPSIAHTQQAALRTDKGRLEALGMMNREMMQKYGVGTGVGSLFNPVAPHTSDDENKTINIPFPDPKAEGGVGKLKVPKELFDQMKADFNDRYFSLAPQQGQTVPNTGGITNAEVDVAGPNVGQSQPAQGGLQAGATRNVGGKDYLWNGTRWEQQ